MIIKVSCIIWQYCNNIYIYRLKIIYQTIINKHEVSHSSVFYIIENSFLFVNVSEDWEMRYVSVRIKWDEVSRYSINEDEGNKIKDRWKI